MKPILHPEADEEFAEAVRYYGEISLTLGNRFYDAVLSTLLIASAHPKRYRMIDPPMRRILVPGFPYAILFAEGVEVVRIVAVMHLHREPKYWKGRTGTT